MPILPADTSAIVITASRAPEEQARSPASVTVIDNEQIRRLGQPLIPALIQLTPSATVSSSGPLGSFTEVRIRGAENNHTLLFIDGIRANDPATGDFARFELLNSDLASRVEVVRGPQSALWGSDAIGGVVAVNGVDQDAGLSTSAEAGAFGFGRASASGAIATQTIHFGAAAGWQRSDGIDSFGAPGGDRDGYSNLSGRLRGRLSLGRGVHLGAAAFLLTGKTQFDGYDPLTGERTDTRDNTRNRLSAGRAWGGFGTSSSAWSGHAGISFLGSSNRNYLATTPINRTRGSRRTVDVQVQRRFSGGGISSELILAGEEVREAFHARGQSSGLPTDQDRDRAQHALTLEWRASVKPFTADLAVRADVFNRFKDARSLRASLLADIGRGLSIAGSYAEGVAQPTFFDQYGTFPNIFVGNPNLKPETSRGFEGSIRFQRPGLRAAITAYRQRLHEEIVDVFDLSTFRASTENSEGVSRRSGLEAEVRWDISAALRVHAYYAYLHATQPDGVTGVQIRERRRPKHSASVAADGAWGRWSYGTSITFAGAHPDTQEVKPFGIVRVKPYAVADARLAYALRHGVELALRGLNLFDEEYEEVAGYRTEGRGLFLGVRLADRRSSP